MICCLTGSGWYTVSPGVRVVSTTPAIPSPAEVVFAVGFAVGDFELFAHFPLFVFAAVGVLVPQLSNR